MARRRRFASRPAITAEPRPRRRWPRRVALGVIGLIPLLAFLAFGVLWLTVPPDSQTLHISGLSAPVDFTFDGNGVPRIRAANELDAATALGFVHARDRMFQMELMRRAASGRLAELLGPSALPIDEQMRVLGLAGLAEGDVAAQTPEARAVLEAYAKGVNAWIANRGRFAALEFLFLGPPEPWRPSDSLLWGRTMSLWLSGNYRTELTRLALRDKLPRRELEQLWPIHPRPLPPQASLTGAGPEGPGGEPGGGSGAGALGPTRAGYVRPSNEREASAGQDNPAISAARALLAALPAFPAPFTLPASASDAWAVDGRWTDTGAPLLAGDPHLSFDFPGLRDLVRIDIPGEVLAGATGPGVPFLVMGRNSHIAWTFTTTGADTQDVYIEPPEAKFTSHQERIKVRGQPDTILTVRATRHGPVISDLRPGNAPLNGAPAPGKSATGTPVTGTALAVAMANLRPGDTGASGLLALNHARTVEEAGKAAPLVRSPVQNLMVADHSTIGLFVTGEVPIRRHGDGWAPVPGIADGPMTPAPSTDATPSQPAAQGAGQGMTQGSIRPPAPPTPPTTQQEAAQGAARAPGGSGGSQAVAQPSIEQNGLARDAGGDDYDGWSGFASGEALPHIVAPASGRLVNANEPVWPPDFPVFMGRDTFADWRARRIRTLLDSTPKHSTSDFAAMQTDVVSTYAAALLPTLRVVPGAPQVLRDWDGAMTESAPQPLIFSAWMQAFHQAVLSRAGLPLSAGSPVFEFVPFVLSPEGAAWCGGDCAPLLKATLDSTMAALAVRFGPDPNNWHWGAVHQAVFAHPLLRSIPILGALTTSRIAVPGDGATLDRGGTNDALEAVHGASYRGVYDLADLDRSLFIMTPGESGNPLSRHARDFLTKWRDGAMLLLGPHPVEISATARLEP